MNIKSRTRSSVGMKVAKAEALNHDLYPVHRIQMF